MSEKKLSIIMPTLNVNSHIGLFKNCIAGLKNQTFSNWELIIAIDGGPNKRDVETLKSYFIKNPDKRIKLYALDSKKPVGPGILRNYCFKYTSGELLTFHDSDDFSEKNRFEKLIVGMESKELDIIASYVQLRFIEAPQDNRVKGYSGNTLKKFVELDKVRAPMHMSSSIISRDLFKSMGGFEHYKFSSDSIFTIKLGYFIELMRKTGIVIFKDPLFVWNRRSESITMAQKNAKILRRCIVKQRTLLAQELRKMNFDSYALVEADIKKFINISDSLTEDMKIDLKLIYYKSK